MTVIRTTSRHITVESSELESPVTSPARALNPGTGKLCTTVRLTEWANGLRYQGVDVGPDETALPHQLLHAPGISLRARGLASLLFVHPADSPPTLQELISTSREGRDALLTAIAELVDMGWVESFYIKARISPELRMAVMRRDGHRCVVCGSGEDLSADHLIPESAGGETTLDNLQAMCRPCNSRKGVS